MNYLGVSCGFHDAALSVVDQFGNILYAGHSERYSKIKHDKNLNIDLLNDALSYITDSINVHYYERPYVKALRQLIAAQSIGPFTNKLLLGSEIYQVLNKPKIHKHNHHLCHAAAGFQTSPFNEATVVIIDAIGELDTITIWNAEYNKKGVAQYKKLYNKTYPNSLGLFYSAMTELAGLKPLDEEYILMGMAAYGKPLYYKDLEKKIFYDKLNLDFSVNLHAGIDSNFLLDTNNMDIASSSQILLETCIDIVLNKAKNLGKSTNLVYGGGVALNCLANRMLGKYFNNIWIMPNPGDAGNSLGAAALGYGKKLNWVNAFLGYNIKGSYPIIELLNELLKNKIVGVANGRAEFGPRALGNRSLLADPRGSEIKNKVNEIKRRQKFRPFAPIILEEYVHDYFTMPINWNNSRYMQVVAECKRPDLYPAICHVDNTSRVQTVPNDDSGIRKLLEIWYKKTGCPLLLNTSLNVRGEPMVNNKNDIIRFQKLYNVNVLT